MDLKSERKLKTVSFFLWKATIKFLNYPFPVILKLQHAIWRIFGDSSPFTYLCIDHIERQHPLPGPLTISCTLGGRNSTSVVWLLSGWGIWHHKGGVGGNLPPSHGQAISQQERTPFFAMLWLKRKGLQKLCAVLEGKTCTCKWIKIV